jgi:hypothetical protein
MFAAIFAAMSGLYEAISEAVELLYTETGADADALFSDRIIDEPGRLSARAQRAAGLIEGASIALGLTALELLWELRLA